MHANTLFPFIFLFSKVSLGLERVSVHSFVTLLRVIGSLKKM